MPEPLLLLIIHLFGVLYFRASQTGNQATLRGAQLYEEHLEARALMTKRNAYLKHLMLGSVTFIAVVVYLLTLLQARASVLPARVLGSVDDLSHALILIGIASSMLSLAFIGRLVARQTQATEVIMDYDFTENRVTAEEVGLLAERVAEFETLTRSQNPVRHF